MARHLFRRVDRRTDEPAKAPVAPSLTSQAVARIRAELDRPHSPRGDDTAQRRLTEGMRTGGGASMRAHMAARTAFVDDAVLAAIARGTGQVVTLGAGYDDRALRFRTSGVRFFEVDQPSTQADKRRRVRELDADADITFVPVDLRADDLDEALARAGQDPSAATLFVCEGLLVYLAEGVIRSLLGTLRDRAALGSHLVASLAIHADGIDSQGAVAVANARRRDSSTEPWRTILPRAEHLALLVECGWLSRQVVEVPSASGSGGTLLVDAVTG
jgi:methyltransferase (TIGR00027 family)